MPVRLREWLLLILILLAAAWARVYRLGDIPPGWRDDEIVETTVHAALVRQGHWLMFFPQAEGHEPLFHYLSAAWIGALGQSLFSVRLLPAMLGLLSVAALYRLSRAMFGRPTALLAAAALAVSFWALMYARFKLRQVSELVPLLLAFYFFWRALHHHQSPAVETAASNPRNYRGQVARIRPSPTLSAMSRLPGGWLVAVLSALFLALAVYTYYAARGGPLLLAAFAVYLLIWHRPLLRARGRALALAAVAFVALAAPLALAIALTPQGEARLAVVGAPLAALLRGDPSAVASNTLITLTMPFTTGDPEFLYNIPGRPVFEPLGAALFAAGLMLCLWRWRRPAYAFLLLWLLVGLAPAFVSTPAASLGHTITAQPAVYLLPAVALAALSEWAGRRPRGARRWQSLTAGLAGLFLLVTAGRDLGDYFLRWPALPEVRGLYRADLHEAAPALRRLPPRTVIGLASGTLAPADALALELELPNHDLRPVVFNPSRAWPFPRTTQPVLLRQSVWPLGFDAPPLIGSYALRPALLPVEYQPAVVVDAAFENNWQLHGYTFQRGENGAVRLDTYWQVMAGYNAPPPRRVEILAGVPMPLKFFAHLLNPDGSLLAGDDRLDVDPATLRPGDTFVQTFEITPPAGTPVGGYDLQVGLYNPDSGRRLQVMDGADRVLLTRLDLVP